MISRKVRLIPTPEQEVLLWKASGVARWVYNWTLNRQQDNYRQYGKIISSRDLKKEITVLKKQEEYSWLWDVSSDVPKQAVKDACDAYSRFFKKISLFPRFKSKRKSKPSFFNDAFKLKIHDKRTVMLLKIGTVKTAEQLNPKRKYYNPRVSFDGKYWYLSIAYEATFDKPKLTNMTIGIDLGIKDLAVCSTGIVYKNINKTARVKKLEKQLRRLQRSVSRKYRTNKGGELFAKTCNIIKLEKRVRHLHRRLSNIRSNHIHQITTELVKIKPAKVVMENLNIMGMMKNRHLSKSIAKQKLGFFINTIKYKCEMFGIVFEQVPRFFPSSKMCSKCGGINKTLKLSDRTYKCECGNEINRDLNAAINLAMYSS